MSGGDDTLKKLGKGDGKTPISTDEFATKADVDESLRESGIELEKTKTEVAAIKWIMTVVGAVLLIMGATLAQFAIHTARENAAIRDKLHQIEIQRLQDACDCEDKNEAENEDGGGAG